MNRFLEEYSPTKVSCQEDARRAREAREAERRRLVGRQG
jgi:hypothetical protein